MARGGLVDQTGRCIGVIQAASDLNTHYILAADGSWIQFVPDLYANVGDHWSGSVWLYQSSTPPGVTTSQFIASCAASGFSSQLNTAINGATTAEKNIWAPPLINASDPVVASLASAVPLTASQVNSLLQQATTY